MKLAEFIKEYDERFNHILGYGRMTLGLLITSTILIIN